MEQPHYDSDSYARYCTILFSNACRYIGILVVPNGCVFCWGFRFRFQDYYFTKGEYQQLVYQALAGLPGLEIVPPSERIHTLPPAIMKPVQRWTGKQVCQHSALSFFCLRCKKSEILN